MVTFAGTGRTPFAGDSASATAMRILTQQPRLTGLPEPLRGIVARTLAKDPAERPTARELVDLLLAADPADGSAPAGTTPPGVLSPPTDPDTPARGGGEQAGRPHRRVTAAVVTVAVLALAVLLGYGLPPGSGADLGGPGEVTSSAGRNLA